jgi:hypothetical protein
MYILSMLKYKYFPLPLLECRERIVKLFWIHISSDVGPISVVGPVTVDAQSTAWTVFGRSNTGIVCLNPTRGMDVCVRLFCVCVVLCVGRGLATGLSPVQGVLPAVYKD